MTSLKPAAASPAMCRRRSDCRLCSSSRLELVLQLTPTPPANAFVKSEDLARPQEVFPLDVHLCLSCGHAQLLDVVDPGVLFENYVYVSGTSPVFVKHFQDYAADVLRLTGAGAGALAVDIGSNDGTLLKFFSAAGLRALGVDPAKAIAAQATRDGAETIPDFFTQRLAQQILIGRGPAAVVTANNVFAHADDLRGIAAGVSTLLAPDGVFVFEVSYLADVVQKTLFDTIYHEHVAYHSVKPLIPFLASQGLELVEALRVPSHGGSLRVVAQRAGGPRRPGASVAERLAEEETAGLGKPEAFRALGRRIDGLRQKLLETLEGFKSAGKKIAGFGAPAKAATLMHHFHLGRDLLEFIVDDSPWKQGLFSPGLHVPVVPATAIAERRPDVLLVLAWNFAESIIAKNAAFTATGGRFVVPVPEVTVR